MDSNLSMSSESQSQGSAEPDNHPITQTQPPPPSLTLFDESACDTLITPLTVTEEAEAGSPEPDDCSEEGELGELSDEESEEVDLDLEEGEVCAGGTGGVGDRQQESPNDVNNQDLEEGEVEDEEDSSRTRSKPAITICRFFGKGTCTWGTNCRFLHPGVIDKGLYNMFDPMRPPLLPPPTSTMKPGLLGHGPKIPNDELTPLPSAPIVQTPWERAQRAAKELIKKAERRKETDIDFEDKKMNLTLTEVEFDKENDYYVSKENKISGSPVEAELEDVEEDVAEALASTRESRYRNNNPVPPPLLSSPPSLLRLDKIDPDFVRERVHHIRVRQAPPRDMQMGTREAPPREESPRMVRESALHRRPQPIPRYHNVDLSPVRRVGSRKSVEDWNDRDSWRNDRAPPPRGHPPTKRGRSPSDARSPSSYSSSRSSSTGSSSSRSSSGSGRRAPKIIRESKVRKAPPRPDSPPPKIHRIAPPIENELDFGRERNYGPPRGGSRGGRGGGLGRGFGGGGMDRAGAQRLRRNDRMNNKSRDSSRSSTSSSVSRSRSRSHSVSRSRSPSRTRRTRSKFSRDRSISSRSRSRSRSPERPQRIGNVPKEAKRPYNSSDSDGGSNDSFNRSRRKRKRSSPSPEVKIIKPEPNEKSVSVLPVQSTQVKKNPMVKMTLKPSTGGLKVNKSVLDRLADDVLDIDDDDDDEDVIGSGDQGSNDGDKNSATRRAELLKQLKAVEDAIAKKRLKVGTGDGK